MNSIRFLSQFKDGFMIKTTSSFAGAFTNCRSNVSWMKWNPPRTITTASSTILCNNLHSLFNKKNCNNKNSMLFQQQQQQGGGFVRWMSKYISKSAKKRLNLTTKRAGKGFYKGKGCKTEGRITSKGRFIVDPNKRLELIIPDLTGFKLKPYIASTVSRFPPNERRSKVTP